MDTRETILQGALELFYTKGYDSVGVQEIAEHAGITKPTLYYYFGSKAGLLKEIIQQYGGMFLQRLRETSRYEKDLKATLLNTASAYIHFAIFNKKFYFLMLSLIYYAKENEAHKAIEEITSELYYIVLHIFEDATSELGNMNGREQMFAMNFIGAINGYILWMSETSKKEEIEITKEQIFSFVHQFMHGIYS